MHHLSKLFIVSAFCSSFTALPAFAQGTPSPHLTGNEQLPRNIIYLIGDGMGPAYTSAYRYYADDASTKTVEKTIFDQLLVGMSSTYPDDDTYVTDSASSATALATSHKTYNGAISVDHLHNPLSTMFEIAKGQGKVTAVVVTSQINHATPASFLAHNESRRNYDAIADSYLSNVINGQPMADLMLGGGTKYFVREHRDLTQEFTQLGYQYINNINELNTIESLPALGLFASKGLPFALGSKDPLRLTTMTHTALELLAAQETPFVLMVEASQIDWCGHKNDIACAMAEMHDFASTLQLVKSFIDANPDTLLVATADHSTGGLTLGNEGTYQWKGKLLHNVTSLPHVIAQAIIDDLNVLNTATSLSTFLSQHISLDIDAKNLDSLRLQLSSRVKQDKPNKLIEKDLLHFIDKITYTGWTTSGHTAIDVPIFAYGKGQQYFTGHKDNTEIGASLINIINGQIK
ncbi:alkaline phosphatase [Shewanella sp. D64]|uniref:alkaline phosphatase n=1 Tax=unclassified Shewanella TaxID=196818 RepID=UPI0022BA4446|nr:MULTISPECIES: alkaline phosphatase [unclassified Shewanella]MEC4726690.1 alkaline phosphatase [Shewanella sp. D64]MEC4738946.1 alkaline phosphatase [Shewanella sp. E94]WBJ96903.1 alkaline phosphatase [Shewanella sp. MTB7]